MESSILQDQTAAKIAGSTLCMLDPPLNGCDRANGVGHLTFVSEVSNTCETSLQLIAQRASVDLAAYLSGTW